MSPTQVEAAAQEIVDLIPLIMRSLGSELRQAGHFHSHSHFHLLGMLAGGPHNLRDLARKHNVTPPTMSNSISALVDRGLVQRRRAEHDRRQLVIELTPDGEAVIDQIRARAEHSMSRKLQALSPEDVNQLVRGLSVLRQLFKNSPEDSPGKQKVSP
jgi:DNA-binding MarR family transcriptional regulator